MLPGEVMFLAAIAWVKGGGGEGGEWFFWNVTKIKPVFLQIWMKIYYGNGTTSQESKMNKWSELCKKCNFSAQQKGV